jgi:hypothetical protein
MLQYKYLYYSCTEKTIFLSRQRTTAIWAAKMDKITEKRDWRALKGGVLFEWCNSVPLIQSKSL